MLILAESAVGGREIAKKTAHVGRITKIVDCIRIVFGLPYNYKPNFITEDDLKAIRAKPFSQPKMPVGQQFSRYKSGVTLQNQTHSLRALY